jgi:sugar/nucleoside kinase (ribokinase family)
MTGAPPSGDPDLIVVGDLLADIVVEAGALVRGGDVHGRVRIRPAGSGANAAVWATARGARVRVFGRVGEDLMGRLLRDSLASRDVEAELVVDPSMPTGAMLIVHEAGERSMVADRGANAGLSPTDLPDVLAAGAVLVSGYLLFHQGSEAAALAALERAEGPVIAVEASSWPLIEKYGADRFLAATKPATMLLANEREAETLTGSTAERAIDQLAGSYDVVVVKEGARGAVAITGGSKLTATAPEVVEADPTGAGDAFDGVLLAELARGSDLRAAMVEACLAGARSATSLDTWPER